MAEAMPFQGSRARAVRDTRWSAMLGALRCGRVTGTTVRTLSGAEREFLAGVFFRWLLRPVRPGPSLVPFLSSSRPWLKDTPARVIRFTMHRDSLDCVASSLREEATALKMTVGWWVGGRGEFIAPTSRKRETWGTLCLVTRRECGVSSFGWACALRVPDRDMSCGGMAEAMPFQGSRAMAAAPHERKVGHPELCISRRRWRSAEILRWESLALPRTPLPHDDSAELG